MARIYDVEPVKKGCKYCHSKTVSWREDESGEGWKLMEMWEDSTGRNYIDGAIHWNFCSRKKISRLSHTAEQQNRLEQERAEHEQKSELERKRDEKISQQNSEWFMALLRLDDDEKRAKLADLEVKLERELRDPVSMDFLVEHCRYVANLKRIKCDIDILRAMLRMPPLYADE